MGGVVVGEGDADGKDERDEHDERDRRDAGREEENVRLFVQPFPNASFREGRS